MVTADRCPLTAPQPHRQTGEQRTWWREFLAAVLAVELHGRDKPLGAGPDSTIREGVFRHLRAPCTGTLISRGSAERP